MLINSKRANEIDAYIKSHNCAKGKQKVVINGEVQPLESYLLPWTLLQYNHENSRFNLEIREEELRISRKLDPTDSEDVEKIKELLLADKTEATKLREDLEKIGEQTEVAAISFDGVVVNGNRRMATLEQLHKKAPAGKWEKLWVVRLPQDISDSDLWKIEAGLQLSKERVAGYGPVNNLLMINEGKKAGLKNDQIAASMYGWTEKQVESDLERLNLIDIFLMFFGQPENYGLIKKAALHEHFEDIQIGLTNRQKKLGWSKKELGKKLELIFIFLRARILDPTFKFTHYDTREMCKILHDNEATYALTDTFESEKDLRKIPFKKLFENFDKASDVKKDRVDADKPGKLIDRAITALNNIDRKGVHYKSEIELRTKLKALDSIVKEMKSDFGMEQ